MVLPVLACECPGEGPGEGVGECLCGRWSQESRVSEELGGPVFRRTEPRRGSPRGSAL